MHMAYIYIHTNQYMTHDTLKGSIYHVYITKVKCFVPKINNGAGNLAKRRSFMIKGNRNRWDSSDT